MWVIARGYHRRIDRVEVTDLAGGIDQDSGTDPVEEIDQDWVIGPAEEIDPRPAILAIS